MTPTLSAFAKLAPAPDRLDIEREFQRRGCPALAGVDEAGRGPLAGPVVAAAVVLPAVWIESGLPAELKDLNDSKQVSPAQRRRFFEFLSASDLVRSAIARVDAAVIDELNILRATHRAMLQAVTRLHPPPAHLLIDGLPVPGLPFPQAAMVHGDARSSSIAAASILAKVTRDQLMLEYDRAYPEYGFARHKGYGTPEHLAALRRLGPCPIHRRSFAPLRPVQVELFRHEPAAPLD